MSNFLSDDDQERVLLLDIVAKRGLKVLSMEQLMRLRALIEKKTYDDDKKTLKSKMKLLDQINHEVYKKEKGGLW